MRTISEKNVTNNYYSICDINTPLLEKNKEYNAESAAEAVKMYLNEKGIRYSSINCKKTLNERIKATPFYIQDGIKYKDRRKKVMWFEVIY